MSTFEELMEQATAAGNKGDLKEAELFFMRALQLSPEDDRVLTSLAKLREKQKRFDAAILYYRRLVELDPYDVESWMQMYFIMGMRCFWDRRDEVIAAVKKAMDELPAFYTGAMLMDLPHTFEEVYNWYLKRAAGNPDLQKVLRDAPFDHTGHKAGKKLKVGYLTKDVGPSPCGYIMSAVWGKHNHTDFEWHCFCLSDLKGQTEVGADDLITEQKGYFDYFHDVSGMEDYKQIAQKIYDEKIDIIIDMNMYALKKTWALAYKPAPIIVAYLGVPATTGLDYYDYIIGDKNTVPENRRQFFTEKVKDLPLCYHPAEDKPIVFPHPIPRELVLLPEDKVVYCGFVTSFKITPKYFDMWCRILKAVPNSVLWLRSREDIDEDNLRNEAHKRGISPDRIIFLNCMADRSIYMRSFENADLFLDSEIWQAHSTCLESLTMNVPLLTCPGDAWASRVPSTMLKAFGMPELICDTEAEYEAKAIDLGLHPEKLNALKERTRSLNTPDNPLFNMTQYTKWFEDALREMAIEKGIM